MTSYLHFIYHEFYQIYAISATFLISCSDITQAYRDIQVNQYKNVFKHFFCEGELRLKTGALLVSVGRDFKCLSSHNGCAVYKTQSVSLCSFPAFSLGSYYILRQCCRLFYFHRYDSICHNGNLI